MSDAIVVEIDAGLRSLVPGFLDNRLKDLEQLRTLHGRGDWAAMARIGHRMKGSGTSYGFAMLTTLGEALEAHAGAADREALAADLATLADLLKRLEVTYR